MPTYSRTNLRDAIWDPKIYSNISSRISVNDIMNEIVKEVISEIDLRSTKRRLPTSPNLFDNEWDYQKPADMKAWGLIDIPAQIKRTKDDEWILTTPEEFDRMKEKKQLLVAILDYDFAGKIRISVNNNSEQLIIASLDTLTGDGGTWEAFSTDSDTVEADSDDFVKGSGSIRFNITAVGGTTAGIKNTALSEFDYSEYVSNNRSIFVWVKIVSTTNLTNWKLRLGETSSAYDEITVTAQADGSAFRAGWNLLRFDFVNKSTTGSPDRTIGTYAACFMTKTAGKISEVGYKVDHIIAQQGVPYDFIYYSKYGWQSSAGTYLENSTADTDLLNADTEEFNLFVQKGRVRKALTEQNFNLATLEDNRYKGIQTRYSHIPGMRDEYKMRYPSEAKIVTTTYQEI